MRNRSNYNFTPAQGDVLYIHQQQAARRPAMAVNYDRLLMLLFFVAVPLMWVVAWIWQAFSWVLFITILATVILLWMKKGFTPRGRLIMTGSYAVFAVLALTTALRGGQGGLLPAVNANRGSTIAPINFSAMLNTPGPAQGAADLEGGAADDGTGGLGDMGGGVVQTDSAGDSACEQVLRQFLEAWKTELVSNMVPLTPPSWRAKIGAAANGAEQKLYWQFYGKKLANYRFDGKPTGTDNDTLRTISVLAEIVVKEKNTLYQYNVIMLQESNDWYVDPASLTGTPVETATEGPTIETGPTAQPTPEPTKAPSKKTKMYYNKKGGKYYHADANCPAVAKEYLPLKSFTYGDLGKSPFDKLQPCSTCSAPARSSQ